jgi:hypothetical protein
MRVPVPAANESAGQAAGFRETLRALSGPERLVPVLLIAAALIAAQVHLSQEPRAWTLALAMALATWAVAPFPWRLLFSGAGALASTAVRGCLFALLGIAVVMETGPWLAHALRLGPTFLTQPITLAVCVALFVVGGWGLGRDIDREDSLLRERARAEALARTAERAQLLALRAHLDPHFLFNTLNAIAEWCRQDGEVAERAVLQLSQMLRGVLDGVKGPTWPLERELELVRALFELHRLRDPALFTLQWEVPSPAPPLALPPLLLLPLAENAMKHGPLAGHRGAVRLSVTPDAERVRIELSNPGPFRGPREGSDGVPMFERRLSLSYGQAATFAIGGAERTTARVTLPRSGPREGSET